VWLTDDSRPDPTPNISSSPLIAFRLVPALALAAVIVFACGPRSHSSDAPDNARTMSGPSILTALDVRQSGSEIAFRFHVTNNANKKLELVFPSGKTHDITIVDAAGEEVWRWSDGRMFTQVLQNRVLGPGDTLTYEMTWSVPARSGHSALTAVASLLSNNHPLEARAEFVVQ
jgi:hypothetical protein